jgi:hypothetical protein
MSIQRGFSQIPNKSRLIFAIAGDAGFTELKLENAVAANASSIILYDGMILNTANADAFIGYINYGRSFNTGDVFRDLGKRLYLQTRGRIDYIFSYVQQVNGPISEGVPANYAINSLTAGNFWICTGGGGGGGIGINVVRAG